MTDSRPIHSVVLVKQVPDTHNITGDVMTKDGTMNRNALPAIFNPEDLNALEMALQIKDAHGGTVTVITMGPPKAAAILRESLFRGADKVVLLTDRKFAGADTLATSYALTCAVEKNGPFDLVLCGRQAIDGDTAQVGPQTAEKLGIPQITYAESIVEIADGTIVVERALDSGSEIVRCKLPCLLTVDRVPRTLPAPTPSGAASSSSWPLPRWNTRPCAPSWPEFESDEALDAYLTERGLKIPVWTAEDIGATEGKHRARRLADPGPQGQFRGPRKHREQDRSGHRSKASRRWSQELVHEYIVG